VTNEITEDAVALRESGVAVPPRRGGGVDRVRTAATYDRVTHDLTGWQFAFTRRWLGYIAFAVIFAVACGFLSNWQLDRGKQAAAANALTNANFYSVPVELSTVLPRLDSYSANQDWKRVTVTGTYLARDQLFVRNRPRGSTPGFEVLTPLRLTDGKVFVVDRGWIGTGSNVDYPAHNPAPPSGTVTVIARLEAGEPAFGGIPSIHNEIETIELAQVKERVGGPVYTGAYGLLDHQTPAAASGLKSVVTTPPTADEGLHWSYMIQWIIFALVGFFGLGYALRTEFRKVNENDPEEQAREAERVRKRARKAFTDAEVEDELLDGFVPLSRWGFGGAAIVSGQPAVPAQELRPAKPVVPDVYVLEPGQPSSGVDAGEASLSDDAMSAGDAQPSASEASTDDAHASEISSK
jgi:cytochrome oxidase assembly protein ShyY1